jgi:hypothetical protein
MLSNVAAYLRQRAIIVKQEWLRDTMEELERSSGGTLPPITTLCNMVLGCWQCSSIQQSSLPCLPVGLSQSEKQLVRGPICVQIMGIINAGEPAYAQYQKIKKLDANLEVDSNCDKKWEPSPKRMLLLELTDGYQTIQAMEYQSIPCLNINTLPGSKICLLGCIPCRRGMLLLTSENVKFLGGSVERLVEENRQAKVLARALCLEEQDNVGGDFEIAAEDDFDDLNDDDLAGVDLDQYS